MDDKSIEVDQRRHLGRRLRLAMYRWHCLVARAEIATRLYISTIATFARLSPSHRIRGSAEWAITGQNVPWKPVTFAPRTVVLGSSTKIKLIPHLGEFDQAALFGRHIPYEAPVFAWLERNAVDRYDAVIEIGANVGIYSLFFDTLIKSRTACRLRRVYAFEPSRKAYGRLLANLAANDAQSVEPFALAISDETGFALFYEPEGHLTNGSLSKEFAEKCSDTVRDSVVATLSGSALGPLFAPHERILLKVDAEGAEAPILAAMAPVLKRYRPDLLIEVLQGVDRQLEALDCLAGYERFRLSASGPLRERAMFADPVDRDWLLTDSPVKIDEMEPRETP
jgi:FkbM family methyltransferase